MTHTLSVIPAERKREPGCMRSRRDADRSLGPGSRRWRLAGMTRERGKVRSAMTRILFYAPLKPPTHPVPSGDRTMARLLVLALMPAGFEIELASRLRARIAAPNRSRRSRARPGLAIADRMIDRARALPKAKRPNAFFTYHLYYKAVDWIGPRVADALDIPYLVAEASHAPKRATDAWAFNHAGAESAIAAADAIFCLNPNDKECLALVTEKRALIDLPPFLDLRSSRRSCRSARRARARWRSGTSSMRRAPGCSRSA